MSIFKAANLIRMMITPDNQHAIPAVKSKSIIIGALFLWSLWVFFPGSYSVDSWSMYSQASTGTYTDWHVPLLSFTWRLLLLTTRKFYSIYLLQMLLYWVFIWLLLVRINRSGFMFIAGTAIAVILLFVPQYVMKDTLMAICWGIAATLLLLPTEKYTRKKQLILWTAVLALSYGLLVRINALLAALPFLYLLVGLFRPRATRIAKAAITLAASVCFFLLNNIITYKLLRAGHDHAAYKLELLDIIGIARNTGDDYMPVNVRNYPGYDRQRTMTQYTPASIDDLYWPADQKNIFPHPDDAIADSVHARWKQAVMQHPFAYLSNRTEGFLYYLRLKKRFAANEYWNAAIWIDPNNPLGLKQTGNYFTEKFMHTYSDLGSSWFFTPWVWLLLNVLLLLRFSKKYRKTQYLPYKVVLLIQLSAVLYTLSQLPVYQHDRDFRYHYWNVFATFIGLVYAFKPLPGAAPQGCAPFRFDIRMTRGR